MKEKGGGLLITNLWTSKDDFVISKAPPPTWILGFKTNKTSFAINFSIFIISKKTHINPRDYNQNEMRW